MPTGGAYQQECRNETDKIEREEEPAGRGCCGCRLRKAQRVSDAEEETKGEGLAQAPGKQAASRDERQQVGVGTPGLPGHSSAAASR